MKKVLLGISSILCLSLFTSCLNDDDNESTATISYFATCDSINFTDENDTIYTKLINESLERLKLAGYGSVFTKSVTVNNNYMGAAIYECNQLAIQEYNKRINIAEMESLKKNIFENHKELLGVNSPDEIPLDRFTTSIALRSSSLSLNNDTIKTYKKVFY